MDIGARVKDARKQARLSQEALARRADMSLSAVRQIEQGGRTDPHYSTVSKLAAGLGMQVSELLEEPAVGDGTKKYRTPVGVVEAQKAIKELLSKAGVEVRYLTLPQQELEARYDAAASLEEAQDITDKIVYERRRLAELQPKAEFPGNPTMAIMQTLLTAHAGMNRVAGREEEAARDNAERTEHIRATREQIDQEIEQALKLAAAS